MSIEINPINLITPYRFDLMIKYLYGKSIVNNYQTSVFKKFYFDHIDKWNGFQEPNNLSKNSFQEFDKVFKDLIFDFQNHQFDVNVEPIPVMSWFQGFTILNGAHRTVSALLTNTSLLCQEVKKLDITKGVFNGTWLDRFSKHGLDQSMTDVAAIQYAKLKSTTHIAVLFPSSREHHSEMINSLHNKFRGKVVYSKEIHLSKSSMMNMMNEFYNEEKWIGTEDDNYSGLQYKARKCSGESSIATILLIDYENLDEVRKAKEDVRELCGISNHSIHISDYHDQAIELSGLFFNENSLTWLHSSKFHNYQYFNRLLRLFKHEIKENNLDIDEYCITASSSLSAFGLREGDDLDYIHIDSTPKIHSHGYKINSHNQYGRDAKIYPDKYDELIFNPEYHFYYKGVKFISLNVLSAMKTIRGENKDFRDLQLISSIFDEVV